MLYFVLAGKTDWDFSFPTDCCAELCFTLCIFAWAQLLLRKALNWVSEPTWITKCITLLEDDGCPNVLSSEFSLLKTHY